MSGCSECKRGEGRRQRQMWRRDGSTWVRPAMHLNSDATLKQEVLGKPLIWWRVIWCASMIFCVDVKNCVSGIRAHIIGLIAGQTFSKIWTAVGKTDPSGLLVELGHISKSRPVRQTFDCELIHVRGAHFRQPSKSCRDAQPCVSSRFLHTPSTNPTN